MLYAVIMRFDSLREIEAAMTAEVRKLHHIGIDRVPKRSTLSDANARRSEKFLEDVYHDLYESNKDRLSSDSRRNGTEEWIKRLRIIDSTTITLFSNVIFKGVGRHPKTEKKKAYVFSELSYSKNNVYVALQYIHNPKPSAIYSNNSLMNFKEEKIWNNFQNLFAINFRYNFTIGRKKSIHGPTKLNNQDNVSGLTNDATAK